MERREKGRGVIEGEDEERGDGRKGVRVKLDLSITIPLFTSLQQTVMPSRLLPPCELSGKASLLRFEQGSNDNCDCSFRQSFTPDWTPDRQLVWRYRIVY